jgi:hypothetical protein
MSVRILRAKRTASLKPALHPYKTIDGIAGSVQFSSCLLREPFEPDRFSERLSVETVIERTDPKRQDLAPITVQIRTRYGDVFTVEFLWTIKQIGNVER